LINLTDTAEAAKFAEIAARLGLHFFASSEFMSQVNSVATESMMGAWARYFPNLLPDFRDV